MASKPMTKVFMAFTIAAIATTTLVLNPTPQAVHAVEQETVGEDFTIVPVIVTSNAQPEKAAHWDKDRVASYSQDAANYWNGQLSGKINAQVAPVEYHQSALNLNLESGALTNALVQEHKNQTRSSVRYVTYVYFLPQDKVTGVGGGKVAASSWSNGHRDHGLFSTGGSIVVGTSETEDRRGLLIAHELGHSFSLNHANSFNCSNVIDPTFNISRGTLNETQCSVSEYTDYLDIMSNLYSFGAVNSAMAENRGMTGDQEIATIVPADEATEYTLKPWGDRSNTQKAFKIANTNGQPLYIELRTSVGSDKDQAVGAKAGVRFLKYVLADRSSLVLPTNGREGANQTWPVGSSFVSYDKSYMVNVISQNEDEARISVRNLTQAEKDEYVVNSVRYDDKIELSSQSTHRYYDMESGREITADVTTFSGAPVVGKQFTLTDEKNVSYGRKTSDENGKITWTLPVTIAAGNYKFTAKTTDENYDPVSIDYTVEKRDFNVEHSIDDANNNVKFHTSNMPSISGKFVVKADDEIVYETSNIYNNYTYTIAARHVVDKNITWSYTGDANTEAASGEFSNFPAKILTGSVLNSNSGVRIKITGQAKLAGEAKVYIDSELYDTFELTAAGGEYLVPGTEYIHGQTVKVEIAKTEGFRGYSNSVNIQKRNATLTAGAAGDSGFNLVITPGVVGPLGDVKYYVNGALVQTQPMKASYNYTLPASFYKAGDQIKVEYSGEGRLNPASRTVISTKEALIEKTSMTAQMSLSSGGATITVAPQPNLSGEVQVTVSGRDAGVITLNSDGGNLTLPANAYAQGDVVKLTFEGTKHINAYEKNFTVAKTSTKFNLRSNGKETQVTSGNANQELSGTVTIAVNGTPVKTEAASMAFRTTIAATEYKADDVITVSYSGDGIHNASEASITIPQAEHTLEQGDVVVRSESGALLNFGNITSEVGVRKQIGTGWGQFKEVNVADFNDDGILDLLANRTADGRLYLYEGKIEGGFYSPVNVGGTTQWHDASIRLGKMNKADTYPTVFATFSNGEIFAYETTNGATLNTGVKLADGFQKFKYVNLGYADNDDFIDIIGQDERGRQIMHRTDGETLINERRFPIGQHWENYQPTSTAHQKDGKTGFIAQREGGNLYYYNLSGGSIISGKALIGINWAPYYILPQSY